MIGIKVRIDGLQDVMKRLRAVDSKVQKKILRKALGKGSKIVLAEEKAQAPRETGLLRKSLGRKTKVYRHSGVVVVIVGPRTGMKQDVRRHGRNKLRPARAADPTKYAHLAGPGRRQVFMTQAAARTLDRVRSVVIEAILQGIEEA